MKEHPADKSSNESAAGSSAAGDLDAVLSQASSLTDELVEELGASKTGATTSDLDAARRTGELADGDTINAQLEQIEQDLTHTHREVAGTHDDSSPATDAMDYKAAAAAFRDGLADAPEPAVPTREDQGPECPAELPPAQEPGVDASAPAPVAASEQPRGKIIQLGKRKANEPDAGQPDSGASARVGDSGQDLANTPLSEGDVCAHTGVAPNRVSARSGDNPPASSSVTGGTAVTAVIDAICAALELIDTPFSRVRGRPRRILGWLAVAILFAAFVFFVLSFTQ